MRYKNFLNFVKSFFSETAVGMITVVSSFFRTLGFRACRFYPSCSQYAASAFRRGSFIDAFFLTTKRLLKCQPFSSGGYDPLPIWMKQD